MDAEINARWVEALRSGKYKQGNAGLHDQEDGTHCCLGVLLYTDGRKPVGQAFCRWAVFSYRGAKSSVGLPKQYVRHLGIEDASVQSLMRMNDSGVPFPKIADWIEGNL